MASDPVTPWWYDWNLSYTDSAMGPMYGGGSVQEAFYQTLQKWFPTYVAEMNRKIGSDVLTASPEYRLEPNYRTLSKDVVASILVNVPHTVGKPENYTKGVRAQWQVNVMVFVYGSKDWQETQALTYAYATCVRALILQQRGLGGLASTTTWDGDEYLEGEHTSGRTTGIAHITFTVTVENVGEPFGGPPSAQFSPPGSITGPTLQPLPEQPSVATSGITITQESIP